MNYELNHFHQNICSSEKKPLEIYMFVDPICPECWSLEPLLKKLQIEYGQYFKIRYVLSGQLANLNINGKNTTDLAEKWEKTASRSGMSCDGDLWLKDPIQSPFLASVAIKAAELQGKRAGIRFLRRIQEVLFLENHNISDLEVLLACAKDVNIDTDEFLQDIHSHTASKAFQCDLKITSEMEVDEIPTLVFFNENIHEEGIKISGVYNFKIYEKILEEMLNGPPIKQDPPSLEVFMNYYKLVATTEVAIVYDLTVQEAERELKKLLLQQKVERIPAKFGDFWKVRGEGKLS
ncbi:ClpXP adapter SpxH family protein [Bacillus spongiae]|uniref:ClpXP adapter protein SpxH n=1 Tax=Bacillus spongiae TaxID=2683610 RepID=A0ABU8HBJ2_9BACI